MITLFFELLRLAAWLYMIALVIHVVLSFVSHPQSAFTTWLDRIVEPVLVPLRRLIAKAFPSQGLKLDWSPALALLCVWLAEKILLLLQRILT